MSETTGPQVGDIGHDGTPIVAVMISGPITRAELDAELARTAEAQKGMRRYADVEPMAIIGINASSNMYA